MSVDNECLLSAISLAVTGCPRTAGGLRGLLAGLIRGLLGGPNWDDAIL